jgi:hypothetical protein
MQLAGHCDAIAQPRASIQRSYGKGTGCGFDSGRRQQPLRRINNDLISADYR